MKVAFVIALVLSFPAIALAQPAKPTEDEIRQAVKDLGDERFAVRQKALKLLWTAGDLAEKPLREAANSSDPEVVRQARVLLDKILYRIDPDTPTAIVGLMNRFRQAAGVTTEQAQVIREMLRLGSKGQKYLLRLLDAVDDKTRRMILDEFAYDDWKVLSALIADGQDALVGELLDKALSAQNESIVPHYAAFHAQTKSLDTRIKEFRAKAEKTGSAFDARVLLMLCRLAGDQDGALWAARRAENPAWLRQVLMEMGRWDELLKEMPRPRPGLTQVTDLGYVAAYTRLAGRDAEFRRTLEQIEAYAGEPARGRGNQPSYAAKALLINERPEQALRLLQNHHQTEYLVELLVGQGKYGEALDLSEAAAKGESGTRWAGRVAHIDLLLRAGLTAKAREWLQKLTQDMSDSTDPGWLDRYSAFQVRLGDRIAVEKRLAARWARSDGSSLSPMFGALYPRLGHRAEALLTMMRQQQPNGDANQFLAKLREIDEGTMPAEDLATLLKSSLPVNKHTNQPNFEVVAQLVNILEQPDVAAALLAHPVWEVVSADARLLLADTLADAGRWPAAATAYRRVWEQDKGAPLYLFLYAQALLRINPNDAKAKEMIERSHRVPLGADFARNHFQAALASRGFSDDAFRELSFATKLLGPSLGAMLDRYADRLAQRGEHAAAAAVHERNILRLLPISAGYRWVTSYGRATANIHLLRARTLLASGKKDEALRELETAEKLHPANLDPPIRLLAALEKAGEKKRADELFERVAGIWRKSCADFPDCAHAHNQLAWLCARCRRNLDEGVTHARKAIELAPLEASYKDTLAELHFQKGERPAAIELMKTCLKLSPANSGSFRRQLTRFQIGQPSDEPAED